MKAYLQAKLNLWKKLENRNKECAIVGGMKEEEFHELFQRYTDYLEDLITHPEKIEKTPEVNIVSARARMPEKHEEKSNLRQVWISHDNYRKLLQVKYALYKKDRKARNPDDVIGELIDSWRKHSVAHP